MVCRLDLLGGLRVTVGERVITRFRARKFGGLLAYLACHPGPHGREVLIELFWPEAEPESGRNSLRMALSSLRRQLEPPGTPSGSVLITDRDTIRLDPIAVTTDVQEFRAALRRAAAASGILAESQLLAEAVDCYSGPLLPAYYEDWVLGDREQLAQEYHGALAQLAARLEEAGDRDRALEYARRAVAAEPLREEAHRRLIRLLATGDPAAALRQYRTLERTLANELDSEPSEATRQLGRQIGVLLAAVREARPGEPAAGAAGARSEDRGRETAHRPPSPAFGPQASVSRPRSVRPSATVTFLLAGLERQDRPEAGAPGALQGSGSGGAVWHPLRSLVPDHGGYVVHAAGGSFLAAFPAAGRALDCAAAAQARLSRSHTGLARPDVRMALHTGDVTRDRGRYSGPALRHLAHLVMAARPGQILCSEVTAALAGQGTPPVPGTGARLTDLGLYRLPGVEPDPTPERLFEVEYSGMPAECSGTPDAPRGYTDHFPAQRTRFVGREAELAQLLTLLAPGTSGREEQPTNGGRGAGTGAEPGPSASTPPGSPARRGPAAAAHSVGSGGGRSERVSTRAPFRAAAAGEVHSFDRPLRGHPPRSARLVTLTGPGGTGKTRLALEAARRLVAVYAGAVWFVPLADLSDPGLAPIEILAALGIRPSIHQDPVDQAIDRLSHQPSLLVLDNCEHLLPAGRTGAPAADGVLSGRVDATTLVTRLLAGAPGLRCLATSRQTLESEEEREFPVPPLPVPGSVDGSKLIVDGLEERPASSAPEPSTINYQLSTLAANESVRLFVDRAQAARPDFQVTRLNAAAVAAVCDALEGLPLAIELAAARAGVLTPAQMVSQLESRLDFLVSRRRDATARHRTLRAAIDWSYQLLSPELQRIFARLSVFRGGWTLEAAEAVATGRMDEGLESGRTRSSPSRPLIVSSILPLDALARLRECSLVLGDERSPAGAGAPEMRFRLLETLREYALEQLPSDDLPALRRRHAEHYLALAERAEPRFRGPEQKLWFERLETEHDNLRAALEWSMTEEPEGGLRLAGALTWFWLAHSHWGEGRQWLDRVLRRGEGEPPLGALLVGPARAKALYGAAWLAVQRRDFPRAATLAEESLGLCRRLGDEWGAAFSLSLVGFACHHLGSGERAAALGAESVARARGLGDEWLLGHALRQHGLVIKFQGRLDEARLLLEESLAQFRQLGDKWNAASVLCPLGGLLVCQDHRQAEQLLEEGLALFEELGDQWGAAFSLSILGHLARFYDDRLAARSRYEEALGSLGALGDKHGTAHVLHNLAYLARLDGDYEVARAHYATSLALFRELDYPVDVALSLEGFAGLEAAEGQHEKSVRRAVCLLAAAEALREVAGAPLPPVDRAQQDQYLEGARAALSEPDFAAARAAGRRMTFGQAIRYALEEGERDA